MRLFGKRAPARRSPAMTALDEATDGLLIARARERSLQERIRTLGDVIDAEAQAVHRAAALDAADLACMARGAGCSNTVAIVGAAQAATAAAAAARAALPAVEAELRDASDAVRLAERTRTEAVKAVLLERADELGRKYLASWNDLLRAHAQLRAAVDVIATATGTDLRRMDIAFEGPRYDLPSMTASPDGEYRATICYVPYGDERAREAWAALARELAADPSAAST